MLRAPLCLAALISSITPSLSEPLPKPMFVRLPPLAVEGDRGRAAVPQTRGALEAANAKASALMDAFDGRVARSAQQAIASICVGCSSSARQMKAYPRRVEATALPEGRIVDDPAQAPAN